jgi:uncharacterized protein (DUF2235 family)
MPLYAFDGTWNSDKPGADQDTNVLLFRQAYDGHAKYMPGVGTRFGALGAVAGGISGAGGHQRIQEMKQELLGNLEAGRDEIDIVGFSRGAALAVHFANVVARLPGPPVIRFLGLWDCVPSFGVPAFGLPDVDVNAGWDLDLPDNVDKCYHALALDERRQTFAIHRLNARVEDASQEGRLFELWFRGVHSDVGGGNKNPGLSAAALGWMLKKGSTCGLPIAAPSITAHAARAVPGCAISDAPWYDVIKNRFRAVRWNDQAHHTVRFTAACNNPPIGIALVDDDGKVTGKFARA